MAANYYTHKTEKQSLGKEKMSYGGDTWYNMGRIYEELKKILLRLANFHLHT